MKIKQGKQFILCSGYDNHTKTDHTLSLISDLLARGYHVKQVEGCFKGQREKSLLVTNVNGPIDYSILFLLRDKYYQDQFVHVDTFRDARAISTNSLRVIELGKFVRALPDAASERDNWTKDVTNDQYWITDLAA